MTTGQLTHHTEVKAQWVRLVDVFALGPFMMYMGVKGSGAPFLGRIVLVAAGFGTMSYNWRNYRTIVKREDRYL